MGHPVLARAVRGSHGCPLWALSLAPEMPDLSVYRGEEKIGTCFILRGEWPQIGSIQLSPLIVERPSPLLHFPICIPEGIGRSRITAEALRANYFTAILWSGV